MSIEIKDVEHLAGLARVAISDNEKEDFKNDLEEILSFVSQIKEASVEALTSEVGSHYNVMRKDEHPHEAGMFTEDLISAAPLRKGNHIVVKKIL